MTLDDDVAAMLQRLRRERGLSLKALINDLIRAGLRQARAPRRAVKRFRTGSADLGPCLVGNVDNVSEILAIAEGESYK